MAAARVALLLLPACAAFSPASPLALRMSNIESASNIATSRRSCLATLGTASFAFGASIFGAPAITFAEKDVSDGGLPPGAYEFNRLLLSQQQVLRFCEFAVDCE